MLMGLDIGDERVGIAFGEEQVRIPQPYGTVSRADAERKILHLIKERSVVTVVAGLPLNDDGSEGPQCRKIRSFVKRLARRSDAEFVFIDEYGSSEEAAEYIRSSGRRILDKGVIDAASAAIILQRYLDGSAPT